VDSGKWVVRHQFLSISIYSLVIRLPCFEMRKWLKTFRKLFAVGGDRDFLGGWFLLAALESYTKG